MEIASLRLIVTQDDLNTLYAMVPPPKVRNVRLYISEEGVSVRGVYQAILPLRFATLWTVAVDGGKIAARLSDIRVVGIQANFLRNYLLHTLASQNNTIQLRDEAICLDPNDLLASWRIPLKLHLAAVRCESGNLVIECDQPKSD